MGRLSGCLVVLVVVGSLGLVSCASLVHSGPAGVTITSEPPAAQVTITNLWTRQPILQATTPVLATLARHAGYMQPARYQIVIEKSGYQPYVLTLQAHLDEHYFGNLVTSGPLGMFVIDPLTGAMYALPPRVHAVLARSDGAGAGAYPPRAPAYPPPDTTYPPLAPDAPDGRRE